ncbi:hypothetical protein [Acidovorax sp. Root568]|nr:hypothetical protein [Acidovorax sp. Root568]
MAYRHDPTAAEKKSVLVSVQDNDKPQKNMGVQSSGHEAWQDFAEHAF